MKTSRKPDEHDKAMGRELARLRKEAGLSQEQVAQMLRISLKQYGKYERGQTRISATRYEEAITILRGHAGVAGGFSEEQHAYIPASARDSLLRILRGHLDDLKLCIEAVERL